MNKKRKQVIKDNQLSELVTCTLAGYPQQVLIEGKAKENPVIIFLHGGPGSPLPFCAGSRGLYPEFTDQFIMVYWDQLGCGINNHVLDDSFGIDQFVEMTVDLIAVIKQRFPENQLMLFGVSWGSVLAAKTAIRVPKLVDRVLIYGQVLKNLTFNEETFDALQQSSMPEKKKDQLRELQQRDSHAVEELKTVMKWIQKYTEGYSSKAGQNMPIGKMFMDILRSPDYKLSDVKAVLFNGTMKNSSLMTELMMTDVTTELNNVEIPYRILQGDTDVVTPTGMIRSFAGTCENANVTMKTIEKSGHMPSIEGMAQILVEAEMFLNGL